MTIKFSVMVRNYRDVQNIREILDLLHQAPVDERGQIWQSQSKLRQVYNITSIAEDDEEKTITFAGLLNFDFLSNHSIYVRINYRDLIFKLSAKDCLIEGNTLTCSYPKVVKAIEERQHQRFKVPTNREIYIVIKSETSNIELNLLLKDFSKKGLGVIISENNRIYFRNNKKFKLVSMNDLVFPADTKVFVRYLKTTRTGLHGGFVFEGELSDSLFQIMTKIILDT